MNIELLLLLFALAVIVAVIIWFIAQSSVKNRLHTLATEKSVLQERLTSLEKQVDEKTISLQDEREAHDHLKSKHAKAESTISHLEEKLITQKEELAKLQKQLTDTFETIAHKVLRTNSDEFAKRNEEKIDLLLRPLQERIKLFEEKIDKNTIDGVSLKEEIKRLAELNTRIGEEANNLTKALKGDSKTQGNWGEFILEKVLERSGLEKDREYSIQHSTINHESSRIQPDVIIHLPENKHLIIDAKVSLTAYEQYINANDTNTQQITLKAHHLSIRRHIKTLSEKAYQTAQKIDSPDFVLMFIPIEASFSVAVQHAPDLFQEAWDQKIVIVSPTTLLATLRTIASIWKQERQNEHALQIASESGKLYDKFVAFVQDMQGIEKNIQLTQKSFDNAMNKLSTGQGNLIRKAEQIKQLGIKTTKSFEKELLNKADTDLYLSKKNQQNDNE